VSAWGELRQLEALLASLRTAVVAGPPHTPLASVLDAPAVLATLAEVLLNSLSIMGHVPCCRRKAGAGPPHRCMKLAGRFSIHVCWVLRHNSKCVLQVMRALPARQAPAMVRFVAEGMPALMDGEPNTAVLGEVGGISFKMRYASLYVSSLFCRVLYWPVMTCRAGATPVQWHTAGAAGVCLRAVGRPAGQQYCASGDKGVGGVGDRDSGRKPGTAAAGTA
jgi:hypothetical protein